MLFLFSTAKPPTSSFQLIVIYLLHLHTMDISIDKLQVLSVSCSEQLCNAYITVDRVEVTPAGTNANDKELC